MDVKKEKEYLKNGAKFNVSISKSALVVFFLLVAFGFDAAESSFDSKKHRYISKCDKLKYNVAKLEGKIGLCKTLLKEERNLAIKQRKKIAFFNTRLQAERESTTKQKITIAVQKNILESCMKKKSTWILQDRRLCYGAKANEFGHFSLTQDGFLLALKFVHISGYLTCNYHLQHLKSKWGCNGAPGHSINQIGTVVTDNKNVVIFPKSHHSRHTFFNVPGFKANAPVLVFGDFSAPMYARKGEKVRVWYGEDLFGWTEADNRGIHCVKVYAMFH